MKPLKRSDKEKKILPLTRKTHRTRRLVLRPYRATDYGTWYDAYVNRLPAQDKYDIGPRPKSKCTKSEFRKLMLRHESLAKSDSVYIYAVFERKTNTLVGAIDIATMTRQQTQMANLGYQIHNRHRRNGYGAEAATAALIIAFKDLHFNRLEAAINLDNDASIRMARAVGMRHEGIKRRYYFENNAWTDHEVYVANPEDVGLKSSRPKVSP